MITGQSTFYCEKGSIVVIPPGLFHCTITDAVTERWCIHFDFYGLCLAQRKQEFPFVYWDDKEYFDPELTALPPPENLHLTFPFFRLADRRQEIKLLELLRKYFIIPADHLSEMLLRRALLQQILAIAFQAGETAQPLATTDGNPVFFQAKSLIDRHFQKSTLTISDVADTLRITPNHLLKLFRRELGITTSEYLQNRRLSHAGELLKGNRLNIAEVAAASGFDDANYFSRLFRKKYQLTPLQYRKQHSKNDK